MANGKVEKVYIQGDEIFRCGDIVKVNHFQKDHYVGRVRFIDYGVIEIDTSKTFNSEARKIDLSSDAFIGLERAEVVE